jgi:catechol 2,3-dioxygenase-like lactoylglutathione lyase family enzyme
VGGYLCRVIHHVSVEVSDLERSGRFYDGVLGPLGWRRQVETHELIGWGMVRPVFFASSRAASAAGGGHVCFAAHGSPAVKAAWEGGVSSGGKDDGPPGSRPQYGPAYYSAYLRDPDGYRIEVAVSTD